MARPTAHRIKRHQIYTVHEAAEATGRNPRTLRRWITADGLPADRSAKPWLIRGEDLKSWLIERRARGHVVLGPAEIWCLPCRRAIHPAGGMAEYRARTDAGGMLIGICPCCERLVHRAVRASDLPLFASRMDVTRA
ncbi:helix-turn-helix domain-containing protein [Rhodovulum sp. DZ06]|uniref:helix-turn-helix domain-containing protein n=1 Tax=Rhodovulum sp. DZ06 TaxID=3425126 RepID=UPI003D325DE3